MKWSGKSIGSPGGLGLECLCVCVCVIRVMYLSDLIEHIQLRYGLIRDK